MRNTINLILIIILSASCTGKNDKKIDKKPAEAQAIKYAEKFSLVETDSCTILTIFNPWQGASGISHVYYLVKKDQINSCRSDTSRNIIVPLEKIVCMSTTQLGMIVALGEENTLKGISGSDLIYDNNLIEKLNDGSLNDIGYESGINNELLITIAPDLIMTYGIGSESAGYLGKIRELGFKVLFNADYLENNPLGRAEWIKVFGALYCREEMADSIFKSIEEKYNSIRELIIHNVVKRPTVLSGLPFRDSWFISPGNSFISQLIEDAGGTYLWKDTKSDVSMPLSIEAVFLKSLKADFWINLGTVNFKEEIYSLDRRLAELPSFKSGNLYNNNNRTGPGGGNDFWESGAISPHLILLDIAAILHPELFNEHELFFYKKVE
jgi:iron complex transport system substrate-binding protein